MSGSVSTSMKVMWPGAHLAALLLLVAAGNAGAATYYFSGHMEEPFGTHPVGTPFSGFLVYPDNQADLSPGQPRGDYVGTYFELDIGSDHIVYGDPGVINVYDRSFYPTDLFHYYTPNIDGTVGGLPLYVASLVLQELDGTALTDAGLPVSLNLADFDGWTASFLELQSEPPVENHLGPSHGLIEIARGSFDVFQLQCARPIRRDEDSVFAHGCFESDGCGRARSKSLTPICSPIDD